MENQVTEPVRRTKTQEKSVWAASFRKNFKISLYLKAISAAAPSDRSPALETTWNQAGEKPCGTQFMSKYSLKVYFECYPGLSSSWFSHLISYLKGVYTLWNHRVRIFLFSLFTLLLFWCFALKLLSFPLPFLSLSALHHHFSSFWGLWCTVPQIDAGFQLPTEQDAAPSVSVCRRVPVTLSNTLFRFAWGTEWQIKRRKPHILSIFLFFFSVNHGHKLLL